MAAITMQADYESADVDLWGHKFTTVPATKTVLKAATALEAKIDDLGEDPDKVVALFGEIVDLRVKAKGASKTKASDLIQKKWDADELTLDGLVSFVEQLGAADRPT